MFAPAPSPWLPGLATDAPRRLVCFPFAGGGAGAFFSWRARMPPTVGLCPVALPGRDGRVREPAARDGRALIAHVADALTPALDRPYTVFGYSMGAWLGFELVRELRRRGAPLPTRLLVAARRAPQLPDPAPPIASLSEPAFIQAIQRYAPIPAAILAEPDLMARYVPLLRADFELLEGHRHVDEPPLPVPITAWYGRDDRTLQRALMTPWAEHTTRTFDLHEVPGGHFFHIDPGFVTSVVALASV